MAHIANLPNHIIRHFFYTNRRVGGIGMFMLTDDADIWTLARATQLLSSKDQTVRGIFSEQLHTTICRGMCYWAGHVPTPEVISACMSTSNLWSLVRAAAGRLGARIDVSGDTITRIIADDISVFQIKAVRGLRTVVRQRHTRGIRAATHEGRVATGLDLDTSSKVIARTLSCGTNLGTMIGSYTVGHPAVARI